MTALLETKSDLPLIHKGKVRDIYKLNDTSLLFIATDRISAFDVVMINGIPGKGELLTKLSLFWFKFLNVKHHVLDIPCDLYPGRTMAVQKLKMLPIEAIVRGYLTGSAWKEYVQSGTVHGITLPKGMQNSQAFIQPLFTPSTKAEQGFHDENIHPDKLDSIIGSDLKNKVEALSISCYIKARDYALTKGIIIADTKFEFGINDQGELILCDEVLTPDSSRFWPVESYEIGKDQNSFDKQYLRDYLSKLDGFEIMKKQGKGVVLPDDVVLVTKQKYQQVYDLLIN